MLDIFKRKKIKHVCNFNKIIGSYYSIYLTEYRNREDAVYLYVRKECECGKYDDELIGRKDFLPSRFTSGRQMNDYIEILELKGIKHSSLFNIDYELEKVDG